MTASPIVTTVEPTRADLYTLQQMGRTAKAAADTFAFREWAARLATKAGPRDYVGQLRGIYDEIAKRWRYVQETEEWIHGNPDSLIRYVLGVKYSRPDDASPSSRALPPIGASPEGWGDCDDVSTVVAAAVRALGMDPYWRVARTDGGAHVSVIARTPKGEIVSIDPVAYPDHPFGWALPAPSITVYELDGTQSSGLGCCEMPTYFSGVDGTPHAKAATQWVAVPGGDAGGPRSLAIPMRAMRLARHGIMIDGCPAVDERGIMYMYDQPNDMWIDERLKRTRLAQVPAAMGGLAGRESRRARRGRRRAKRRRVIRRVAQRARNVVGKVASSPLVQRVAGAALRSVGVPAAATRAALSTTASVMKAGGIPGIARLARRDPRAAGRLVAGAAKQGLRASVGLRGVEGDHVPLVIQQPNGVWMGQPVVALSGLPGFFELGALEVTPVPTPGHWYKIQRGDNLLKVTGAAYGLGSGSERLKRARWINAVQANQYAFDPSSTDNLFKSGKISFMPRFADDPEAAIKGESGSSYATIWIPVAQGDEPPPAAADDPVEPDVPDVPPADPVEPPQDDVTPDLPPDLPETPDDPPEQVEPPVTPDVVEPPVDTVPSSDPPADCVRSGGKWTFDPSLGVSYCECPPGMNRGPDGTCVIDPYVELKRQCAQSGGRWNGATNRCVCGPNTLWDGTQCKPIAPDIPDVVVPPDPVIPEIDPVKPDSTTPDSGPGWGTPPGPQQGTGGMPLLLKLALGYVVANSL